MAGRLAHTLGALHTGAQILVRALVCHSLPLTHSRAHTPTRSSRHVPCEAHATRKLLPLRAFFLLHPQALLAPLLHHPPPSTVQTSRGGQTCLLSHSPFRALSVPPPCPFSHTRGQSGPRSLPPVLCPVPRPPVTHGSGAVEGVGCVPGRLLHSVHTHINFLLPSCAHAFSHGPSPFLLFHPPLLAHLLAHSHPNTFIHSSSHSPSTRRCSHSPETRQSCSCWASAPSPADTGWGLARDQQFPRGYRAEGQRKGVGKATVGASDGVTSPRLTLCLLTFAGTEARPQLGHPVVPQPTALSYTARVLVCMHVGVSVCLSKHCPQSAPELLFGHPSDLKIPKQEAMSTFRRVPCTHADFRAFKQGALESW